ncbi:MAG TPA: molybdopterin-dependent oxidoreductase [Rubrivivax sp.]|nr:molybdopterin-dependent oxidoreductase [Rubrivivax sp.]
MSAALPPGQREREDFPRFGLPPFADRQPVPPFRGSLRLLGRVVEAAEILAPLAGLERIERLSDFHCVTTWSKRNLRWGGVRFSDFYAAHVAPRVAPGAHARFVTAHGLDGYRTTLWLPDLLTDDALLADTLNGAPLSIGHGAPLRLVLPAQYGYKSVKHMDSLGLWDTHPRSQLPALAFMDHLRARVDREERGRWLPAWLLRQVYRPLIPWNVKRFSRGGAAASG